MANELTKVKGSKFRPSSEQIITGIKVTKQKANKLNKEQKGVVNYAIMGIFFSLFVLFYFGTSEKFETMLLDFTSGELALFGFVFATVFWIADKLGIQEQWYQEDKPNTQSNL